MADDKNNVFDGNFGASFDAPFVTSDTSLGSPLDNATELTRLSSTAFTSPTRPQEAVPHAAASLTGELHAGMPDEDTLLDKYFASLAQDDPVRPLEERALSLRKELLGIEEIKKQNRLVKTLEGLAGKGSLVAAFAVGECLRNLNRQKRTRDKGENLLQDLCTKGFPAAYAYFLQGESPREICDFAIYYEDTQLFDLVIQGSEKGIAFCDVLRARFFLEGFPVPARDGVLQPEPVDLLERLLAAARTGSWDALEVLVLYYSKTDPALAANTCLDETLALLQAACDRQWPAALKLQADLLAGGTLVPMDYNRAKELYQSALDAGCWDAAAGLARLLHSEDNLRSMEKSLSRKGGDWDEEDEDWDNEEDWDDDEDWDDEDDEDDWDEDEDWDDEDDDEDDDDDDDEIFDETWCTWDECEWGDDDPEDSTGAVKLLREGCNHRSAPCLVGMANAYCDDDFDAHWEDAQLHFEKAAKLGDPEPYASFLWETILQTGRPAVILAAQSALRELELEDCPAARHRRALYLAANLNGGGACTIPLLDSSLEAGPFFVPPVDTTHSLRDVEDWLLACVQEGYAPACATLAEARLFGLYGMEQDVMEARAWARCGRKMRNVRSTVLDMLLAFDSCEQQDNAFMDPLFRDEMAVMHWAGLKNDTLAHAFTFCYFMGIGYGKPVRVGDHHLGEKEEEINIFGLQIQGLLAQSTRAGDVATLLYLARQFKRADQKNKVIRTFDKMGCEFMDLLPGDHKGGLAAQVLELANYFGANHDGNFDPAPARLPAGSKSGKNRQGKKVAARKKSR